MDSSDRKSTVLTVLCGTGNARGSTLAKKIIIFTKSHKKRNTHMAKCGEL